jgi:hypothetical protein
MKHITAPFLVLCFAVHTLSSWAAPEGVAAGGWTSLFDGKSFDGWTFDVLDGSKPETIWSVEDGTIMGRGKGKSTSVIRTLKDHANYELELEWRWPGKPGNSGLLVHCGKPRCMNIWPHSVEVQLANRNAGDFWVIGETIEVPEKQIAKGKGGKPSRRRLNLTDDSEKKPGEWNKMRVVVAGKSITVYVNGDLVNKGTNCSVDKGAICLQSERADVQFRNIRLRSVTAD